MHRARLLGALATIAVLVVPTAADAAGRAYRLTQAPTLEAGQDAAFTLACRMGDVATDGTWRAEGLELDVLEAASVSRQGYRFEVSNDGASPTRVHLTVICLRGRIGGERLQVSRRRTTSATIDVPGGAALPEIRCPAGTVAIAPGFRIEGGTALVTTRFPRRGGLRRATLALSAVDPVRVISSTRCLRERPDLRFVFRAADTEVAAGRVESFSVACRGREVAMAGGYRLSSVWYLGQTAGERRRSFRLQASSMGTGGRARLGLLCLHW